MAETKEYPVLITEPLLNLKENRQKITKILFEKHKIDFHKCQIILKNYY